MVPKLVVEWHEAIRNDCVFQQSKGSLKNLVQIIDWVLRMKMCSRETESCEVKLTDDTRPLLAPARAECDSWATSRPFFSHRFF